MLRFFLTTLVLFTVSGGLFVAVLVIAHFPSQNDHGPPSPPEVMMSRMELALRITARIVGLLIAVAAAVELASQVFAGREAANLLTCALLLLGGLLIVEQYWGTGIAFGLVALALAVRQWIYRQGEPISLTAAEPGPGGRASGS